jgi:hypothetical protein
MISLFKLVANGASLICGVVWRRPSVGLKIGTSSLGEGGSPGIPNHNKRPSSGPYGPKQQWSSDEPLFRAIKWIIWTRRHSGGVVEYFFERSVPDLLARSALHFSFHYVNRGVANQRQRIKTDHLPRDTWNRY